jgi:uncharacterized protein involved in exopolysaccharide biosynthesis
MHTLTTVLYVFLATTLYVFLAATLYMFLTTSTFEAGALLTANMGQTQSWRCMGLAGTGYAVEEDSGKQAEEKEVLFWSPQVREWRNAHR